MSRRADQAAVAASAMVLSVLAVPVTGLAVWLSKRYRLIRRRREGQ